MHIYLIGYRGSGKSTVGRALADALALAFIDTDRLVEEREGQSISDIFALHGEAEFRKAEVAAIASVAASTDQTVIALGGGAILREENRRLISAGIVIWLSAPAEHLYQRISADANSVTQRPKLSDRGGYAEVVEVLAAREPIYRELAQKIVQVAERSPDEIVAEIADWVTPKL